MKFKNIIYTIHFKKWFFIKKKFDLEIRYIPLEFRGNDNFSFHKCFINEYSCILQSHLVVLKSNHYIVQQAVLIIYKVKNNFNKFKFLEIKDICIRKKYRKKGIGTQLIRIISDIAKKQKCKFIIGVLEIDKNLTLRKKFFQKNGFKIFYNKNIPLSRWGAKKII